MNIQAVSLDVTKKPNALPVIRLRQGDKNGTTIVASIFDDGEPLSLTGKAVKFAMQSPDGAAYYDVDGSTSGNVATFEIDETYACAITGVTDKAYVKVLEGTAVICSTNRILVVIFESAEEGADPEQSYSSGIAEATNRANAAAEAAEGVILQAVPLMSETVRGGAQLGDGLSIVDGKLTADGSAYELPTMGANTKGGAKLGGGLSVANDALSVSPVTTAQVDGIIADTAVTGDESLSATGLAYFWGKLKAWAAAAFAAISHSHQASDITSGTLSVARGGTGADTAAGARTGLDVYSTGDMDTALAGKVSKSGDTMTGALTVDGEVTATDANDAVHNLTEKVDKSGDTMAGTLTNEGYYFIVKSTNIDRDGASPSSDTYSNGRFYMRDKDGEFIGQMRIAKETNGRNSLQLMVGNENTSGSEVTNTIGIRVDKDGVRSYTLSDAGAFCDALGIGTFVTKDISSNVSVANSTYKSIGSLDITPGVWVFTGSVLFASNATGRRYMALYTSADVVATGSWERGSAVSQMAVNGAQTRMHTSMIVLVTASGGATIYLTAWQNSGSALNATGYIRAVKVSS